MSYNKHNIHTSAMLIPVSYGEEEDAIGDTPLNFIRERMLSNKNNNKNNNKNHINNKDEDKMESQKYNNTGNTRPVYFRLMNCCPKPNYYLIMALICAVLLHNNNFSVFYTDDRLNIDLLGVNGWW